MAFPTNSSTWTLLLDQTNPPLGWQHCHTQFLPQTDNALSSDLPLQEQKFSNLLISTTNPTGENQNSDLPCENSREWIDINELPVLPQSNKASSISSEDVPAEKKKKVEHEPLPVSEDVILIEDDEDDSKSAEKPSIVIHAILDGRKKKLFETTAPPVRPTEEKLTKFEETPVIIVNPDFEESPQQEEENEILKVLEDFLCDHCEFKTKRRDDFRDHLKKRHPTWYEDLKWFKCGQCVYTSSQFTDVLNHSKSEHKVKAELFHCKCSYVAATYSDLFDHILKSHIVDVSKKEEAAVEEEEKDKNWADFEVVEDERFQCEFCSYGAASRKTLTKHIKSKHWSWYNDGKWYMCGFCSYTSTGQLEVSKHTKSVHKKDVLYFHCKCSFKTSCFPNLVKHVDKHLRIREEIERDLETFTDKNKEKTQSRKEEYNLERLPHIFCALCHFTTKLKTDLIKHMRAEHKSWYEDKNWYKCGYCTYTADTQCLVTKHTRLIHQKNAISWYYCKCTFQTLFFPVLETHIQKNHAAELKPKRCTRCAFSTPFKPALAVHMKIKHPEIQLNNDSQRGNAELWYKCCKCPHLARTKQVIAKHFQMWHLEERDSQFKICREEEPKKFTLDECVQKEVATGGICVYKCAFCHFKSIVSCSKVVKHIMKYHSLVKVVPNPK